jgi:hypothetical protein
LVFWSFGFVPPLWFSVSWFVEGKLFGCLIGLLCKWCFEALLLLKQGAVFWCIIGPQPAWLNSDGRTLPTVGVFGA